MIRITNEVFSDSVFVEAARVKCPCEQRTVRDVPIVRRGIVSGLRTKQCNPTAPGGAAADMTTH